MKESFTTKYVIDFMEKNEIAVEQVAEDTGIPKQKLISGTKEKLEAAEFLCLCAYLRIRPEEIEIR